MFIWIRFSFKTQSAPRTVKKPWLLTTLVFNTKLLKFKKLNRAGYFFYNVGLNYKYTILGSQLFSHSNKQLLLPAGQTTQDMFLNPAAHCAHQQQYSQTKTLFGGFFKKISFKGKGYYMFKNKRNMLTFRFGKYHRTYLLVMRIKLKFITKRRLFFKSRDHINLSHAGNMLKSVRPINVFTGRGIRFKRQILYRKLGKESSYR